MQQFLGVKYDGDSARLFWANAPTSDEAYLLIGEQMTGERQGDPGNVDLDEFYVLPDPNIIDYTRPDASRAVELKQMP